MREIKISEILRYVGHHSDKKDTELENDIQNSIQEIKSLSHVKKTYLIFEITAKDDKIFVQDTNLVFEGKNIYDHLKNCDKIAIMLVSLGHQVDRKINYYQKSNMYKSVIFNAVSAEYVEVHCDDINNEINNIAEKTGYKTNFRYSPGYGDFSIKIQKNLLKILKSEKFGVTCTDNFMMMPSKSVTAIIGFYKEDLNKITENKKLCDICNIYDTCEKRKRGDICGKVK